MAALEVLLEGEGGASARLVASLLGRLLRHDAGLLVVTDTLWKGRKAGSQHLALARMEARTV